MSGYLDQMKKAIERGDLEGAATAYTAITGEPVKVGKMGKAVKKAGTEEQDEGDDGGVTTTGAKLGGTHRSDSSKKGAIKIAKVNLFVDDGEDRPDLKQRPEEKQAIKKVKVKGRPKAKTFKVKCAKCKVPAFLSQEAMPHSVGDKEAIADYICGDCLAKKGM